VCICAPLVEACSSASPEQQVLINFFRASRVRDTTTLGNFAAVSFDPRTDGTVQKFTIVDMGAEHRRALQIKQLTDEAARLKTADENITARKKAYEDGNLVALQRIARTQRAGQPVTGKDADVLTSWSTLSEDERQSTRQLTQVRARLAAERAAAVGSLTPPGQPDVDVSTMDVDVISREITVNADVRTPDGRTSPKMLVFTLQRAISTQRGQSRSGRWIILGFKPGPASEKTE
jgi:hypothetical protein